jgi:hypothetical protein
MSELVVGSTLKEFFKLLLEDAIARQKVTLAEVTEFYVVNLLSEFAQVEKLFPDEPLAILYHRALQADREQKIKTLRRLGDVSLYKAGFFGDSIRDSAVGPDYYIQMGGAAYAQVADLTPGGAFGQVYRELHEKFRALVEVLEEISARHLVASGPTGQMKVFESWQRTASGRLEKVLVDAGMLPAKGHLPS